MHFNLLPILNFFIFTVGIIFQSIILLRRRIHLKDILNMLIILAMSYVFLLAGSVIGLLFYPLMLKAFYGRELFRPINHPTILFFGLIFLYALLTIKILNFTMPLVVVMVCLFLILCTAFVTFLAKSIPHFIKISMWVWFFLMVIYILFSQIINNSELVSSYLSSGTFSFEGSTELFLMACVFLNLMMYITEIIMIMPFSDTPYKKNIMKLVFSYVDKKITVGNSIAIISFALILGLNYLFKIVPDLLMLNISIVSQQFLIKEPKMPEYGIVGGEPYFPEQ